MANPAPVAPSKSTRLENPPPGPAPLGPTAALTIPPPTTATSKLAPLNGTPGQPRLAPHQAHGGTRERAFGRRQQLHRQQAEIAPHTHQTQRVGEQAGESIGGERDVALFGPDRQFLRKVASTAGAPMSLLGGRCGVSITSANAATSRMPRIESPPRDRVQRMCRIADHHHAPTHRLSCAQQAERIRGTPCRLFKAPQPIAETLLKSGEELSVIEAPSTSVDLRIKHCPYHGAATFTHRQQRDRPAVGEAFIRHVAGCARAGAMLVTTADRPYCQRCTGTSSRSRIVELPPVCSHQQPARAY